MTSLSLLRSVDIDGSLYDPLEDVSYGRLNSYVESAYDDYISGETYGYINEGIGEAIKKFFKTIIDTIKSIASKIWNGIKSLFGKAKDKAGELSKGSEKKRSSTFKESDTKYDFIYFEGLNWNIPDIIPTITKELGIKSDKLETKDATKKLKDEKQEKRNNDTYTDIKDKETPFEKFGFKKQSSDYEKLKDLPSGKMFNDKRVNGYAHESLRLVQFNGTRKEASDKASAALNSLESTCGAKKFSTELTKVAKELEAKYLKNQVNEAAGDSEESGSQNQGENNNQNSKDSWGTKEYNKRTENSKVNDDDSGAAKVLKIVVQHIQKIGLAIFKLTYGAVRQTYDTLHGNSLDGKANEENMKYRKEERDKKAKDGKNNGSNDTDNNGGSGGGESDGNGSGASTQNNQETPKEEKPEQGQQQTQQTNTGSGSGNSGSSGPGGGNKPAEQDKPKGKPTLRDSIDAFHGLKLDKVTGQRPVQSATRKRNKQKVISYAKSDPNITNEMLDMYIEHLKKVGVVENVTLSELKYMNDNYYEFL